ncbi:hypothetical protein ABIC75_003524 [Dyella japonica]|uniref:Uncharacterized protein n=1 Tax=Dyella japonica TaxID=231455 RepID=A0ABV2JY69_9GAMM
MATRFRSADIPGLDVSFPALRRPPQRSPLEGESLAVTRRAQLQMLAEMVP